MDFSKELSATLDDNSLWMLDGSMLGKSGSSSGKQSPMRFPQATPPPLAPAVPDQDIDSSDDEGLTQHELERNMQAMALTSEFPWFLGKSSRLRFFKQAYESKQSYTGSEVGNAMFSEQLRLSLSKAMYLRSQFVRCSTCPLHVVADLRV